MHVQKIIIGKRSWRDNSKNDGSLPEKAGGCVDLYGSRTPELTSRHRVDAEPAGLEEDPAPAGWLGWGSHQVFFSWSERSDLQEENGMERCGCGRICI